MCRCGCGSHREFHGGHDTGDDLPLRTIEEETQDLLEMKEALEKRLETVNKRLEALKR